MDKEFHKKVGINIRKYREAKGFSQFTFAIEIDCTPSTISGIETGKCNTTLARLFDIAKALDIEPYELLVVD